MHEALKSVDEARLIASIFCSDAAVAQVDNLFKSATLDEYSDVLYNVRDTVIAEARKHLGVLVLQPSSDLLRKS
jgi:hypothetical protein